MALLPWDSYGIVLIGHYRLLSNSYVQLDLGWNKNEYQESILE
jgi:hypothetical protein